MDKLAGGHQSFSLLEKEKKQKKRTQSSWAELMIGGPENECHEGHKGHKGDEDHQGHEVLISFHL